MEKDKVTSIENEGMADSDIGRMITNISYSIRQYFERMYIEQDITYPQSRVLSRLFFMTDKGIVNQRDLENALGIKASSVSSLVRNLEQKGLVRCERQPQDTRNKSVILTEKGFELQQVLANSRTQMEEVLSEGLTEEEHAVLCTALTGIMERLDEKLSEKK